MDTQTYKKKRIISSNRRDVLSMDCSPCGKYIVCTYMRDWLRKFDLVSQKLLVKNLDGHDNGIDEIRFSPNGQLIASGSCDKKIIIRNAFTLQQIGKTLLGHEGWVSSVAFSPDSLHLASASRDGTIIVWDCQSQEQVCPNIIVAKKIHSLSHFCASYSPCGSQILSAGIEGISIWDSKTRKRIITLTYIYSQVAQYSVDGKYIVSSNRKKGVQLQLLDATNGKQIVNWFVGLSCYINSVAFSPDSLQIVSGGVDKKLVLWNSASAKKVSILHTHGKYINTVKFCKDGKYALSGSADGTICIVKMKL